MRRKRKHRAIVLIGFMGSGKTTVGIRLSYRLRRAMEDTDKMIERREGRTISTIFAEEGEGYFREQETALLQELADKGYHQILSVGGGTPIKEENRKLLKKIGTVIYLRVRPETVYERLKGDNTRPLLQGDNPLEKITTLLEQRKAAYEEAADIVLDADDKDMDTIVEEIVEEMKEVRKHHETVGH